MKEIKNKELIEFAKIIDKQWAQKMKDLKDELRAEFDDTLMAVAPPLEKQIREISPLEKQVKEVPKAIKKSGIKKVTVLLEYNDGRAFRYTIL